MPYVIGAVLALVLTGIPAFSGIGRGRNFYPIMLIVVASYYVLFAAVSASLPTLLAECVLAVAFTAIALLGFNSSLWLVAIALACHGLMDSVHHLFIRNTGVPVWWPGFCLAFDVVAGAVLAMRLRSGSVPARQVIQEAA